jgi:hypothetical protein
LIFGQSYMGGSAVQAAEHDAERKQSTEDCSPTEIPHPGGLLQRLEQRPGLSGMVALTTFAALGVGVLAAVPDWRDMVMNGDPPPADVHTAEVSVTPTPSSADTPDLRVLDLVLRDPLRSGGTVGGEPEFTLPSAEFTVHNPGTHRAVITRVIMKIEDSAVIEQCAAEGMPVAVSAEYDVLMPLRPADGAELQVPVSQHQASDEADRFTLRFGSPEPLSPTTVHLYRIRFELALGRDGARLDAGTAVVATPFTPVDGAGYFWSADHDSGRVVFGPDFTGREEVIACMKSNSGAMTSLLSGAGGLSPALARSLSDLRTG